MLSQITGLPAIGIIGKDHDSLNRSALRNLAGAGSDGAIGQAALESFLGYDAGRNE